MLRGEVSAPELSGRLDTILDRLAVRRDVHGVVMGVASGDRSFEWLEARGVARPDGPAMTPDTPFFIASVTKLHIAATVMRMVEEGELSLDHRLVDHLPSDLTRGLHVRDGVDRTGEITLEHLLAHASGLADFIEDHPPRGGHHADRRSLVERLVEEGDTDWSVQDTVRRVREDLRPHFPPQDLSAAKVRIRYSDTNYQLLMAVVEARRARAFPEVLQELVLDPLGLHDSWVPLRSGHADEPRPAAVWHGDEIADFPRFFAAIGDLNATARDLLDFMRAMVEGRLFRAPHSWARMRRRFHRFSHPLDRAALRQPSWPIEYGLGVMRFRMPRLFTPFRALPAAVGHTGSTGTWLFHVPELDLYLVGSVSQITAGAVPFRAVPKVLAAAVRSPGA